MARLNYDVSKSDMTYKPTKWDAIITEFEESGREVAEILWDSGEYTNPESVRGVIYQNLKRKNKQNAIGIRVTNSRVFLYREEV